MPSLKSSASRPSASKGVTTFLGSQSFGANTGPVVARVADAASVDEFAVIEEAAIRVEGPVLAE